MLPPGYSYQGLDTPSRFLLVLIVARGVGQCYWQGHPELLAMRFRAEGQPGTPGLPLPHIAETCQSLAKDRPSSLLDNVGQNCTMSLRKYKRCYCRVISGLEKDPRCRFVTLTSSPDAINPIQQDFRRLIMRLKRRNSLRDYIRVIEVTQQGAEHVHMIYRGDFIDKLLLKHMWTAIHQSPIVDIRKIWGKNSHYKRVAGYLAKEMSKQGFRRYSWSWGWVYRGFALTWRKAKQFYSQARFWSHEQLDFDHFIDLWHIHLRTASPPDKFLLFLEAQAIQARMSFLGLTP